MSLNASLKRVSISLIDSETGQGFTITPELSMPIKLISSLVRTVKNGTARMLFVMPSAVSSVSVSALTSTISHSPELGGANKIMNDLLEQLRPCPRVSLYSDPHELRAWPYDCRSLGEDAEIVAAFLRVIDSDPHPRSAGSPQANNYLDDLFPWSITALTGDEAGYLPGLDFGDHVHVVCSTTNNGSPVTFVFSTRSQPGYYSSYAHHLVQKEGSDEWVSHYVIFIRTPQSVSPNSTSGLSSIIESHCKDIPENDLIHIRMVSAS